VTAPPKPEPRPTPETLPFWEGCAAGELRIQHCKACDRHVFYPRPLCPHCGSGELEWVVSDGTATLHSYVISHRPAPGFAADVPYVIAVVELPEGVRMMTNLVNVDPDPEQLPLDMPLRVVFEQRGEMHLPVFEPAGGAA
jgi:uncharacterized OB-fold protein